MKLSTTPLKLIASWFGAFFFVYSMYYAGMLYSNEFSGSYGRYLLILVPPLLLLAGHGLWDTWIHVKNKKIKIVIGALFFLSIIPTVRGYKRFVNTSPFHTLVDAGPVAIHEFVEKYMIANTPPHALILTSMTGVALMHGRPTAQFWSFLDDPEVTDFVIEYMKQGKPAYATAPFQCDMYPAHCEKIRPIIEFIPVQTSPAHPDGVQFVKLKLRE